MSIQYRGDKIVTEHTHRHSDLETYKQRIQHSINYLKDDLKRNLGNNNCISIDIAECDINTDSAWPATFKIKMTVKHMETDYTYNLECKAKNTKEGIIVEFSRGVQHAFIASSDKDTENGNGYEYIFGELQKQFPKVPE